MKANIYTIRTMLMTMLFMILMILFFEQTSVTVKAEEIAPQKTMTVYYECVKIRRGETLKDYAEKYNIDAVGTDEEYMDTVRRINGMKEDRLYPGCFLTIPRYL